MSDIDAYTRNIPGIYQIPEGLYRASEAVSKHDLDLVAKGSPGHLIKYRRDKRSGTLPEHSAATRANFDAGTALHLMVLEPARADRLIVVRPSLPLNTKAGQASLKTAQDKADIIGPDALILTEDQHDEVAAWAGALRADPRLASWLDEPSFQPEASLLWRDPLTGMMCRGRADAIVMPPRRANAARPALIIDIKTAADASPEGFGRAAANLRYHAQAAFYCDGYEALSGWGAAFVFVVVEKATCAVATYYLDDDDLDAGRWRYQAPLMAWADHQAALAAGDQPPDFYDPKPQRLSLPAWEHKQARDLARLINRSPK